MLGAWPGHTVSKGVIVVSVHTVCKCRALLVLGSVSQGCSELPASLPHCASHRNAPYTGDTPVLGVCLRHSGFAPPFALEKAAGAAELEDLFVLKPDVLEREPEDRPAAPSAPGAFPGRSPGSSGLLLEPNKDCTGSF